MTYQDDWKENMKFIKGFDIIIVSWALRNVEMKLGPKKILFVTILCWEIEFLTRWSRMTISKQPPKLESL